MKMEFHYFLKMQELIQQTLSFQIFCISLSEPIFKLFKIQGVLYKILIFPLDSNYLKFNLLLKCKEIKCLKDDLFHNRNVLKSVYKNYFVFTIQQNRNDIDLPFAHRLWENILIKSFPIMKQFMEYATVSINITVVKFRDNYLIILEFFVQCSRFIQI
ncbi:unnamed protein product [Paramecium octaurelia]|uniref:Uncharacterized protein n=1 Tax=Paramecium octaurelia TaxID=43137 RepID=A0A8S1SE28_PAROT|nr:unnamed protein product [Paramecium octaurelia]